MLSKLKNFWQKETVLCIAGIATLLTIPFVPPDSTYLGYLNLHVLVLLFCLMAVVAGLKACGLFAALTSHLLKGRLSGRKLGLILVGLPFFSAMLVTNDVALLVFVPFTIELLSQIKCQQQTALMLVMQTVAANLGSMATPVGNPQNLFLYATYHLSSRQFFGTNLPYVFISLFILGIAAAHILPPTLPEFKLKPNQSLNRRLLLAYSTLFLLSIAAVFRLIPDILLLPCVTAGILLLNRKLLKNVDYALLATFVCFFIISGNLGRIECIDLILQRLLGNNALLTTVAASQVISNVPAAVLLSTFTDNWQALLLGVNIGGLGTPVASLASLITLKLYLKSPGAKLGRFMAIFLVANLSLLLLLLAIAAVI